MRSSSARRRRQSDGRGTPRSVAGCAPSRSGRPSPRQGPTDHGEIAGSTRPGREYALTGAGPPIPSEAPTTGWRSEMEFEPEDMDIEERLEALEMEHEVLSARHELLQKFLMMVIGLLAKDQDREALRGTIEERIRLLKFTTLHDEVNDLQDLLAAFNAAMPPAGK